MTVWWRLRSASLAVALVTATAACSVARNTPQQEWVLVKFRECQTLTNAINVTLDRVTPEGRYYMTVAQTQTEGNRLVACMRDDEVSVRIYRREAEAGTGWAMSELGYMYETGRGGLARDDAEAVKWYRKGAEARDAGGMSNLGFMYAAGRGGLARDDVEAVTWYRQAADAGNGRGMALLGFMYGAGLGGLAKDEAEAVKWYRKAAEHNDSFGMYQLGHAYELGLGVVRDRSDAVQWYRKAAALGHQSAAERLKALGESGR